MRVTLLIGHASTLVEMTRATCLMDPVFLILLKKERWSRTPRESLIANEFRPSTYLSSRIHIQIISTLPR